MLLGEGDDRPGMTDCLGRKVSSHRMIRSWLTWILSRSDFNRPIPVSAARTFRQLSLPAALFTWTCSCIVAREFDSSSVIMRKSAVACSRSSVETMICVVIRVGVSSGKVFLGVRDPSIFPGPTRSAPSSLLLCALERGKVQTAARSNSDWRACSSVTPSSVFLTAL